MPPTGAGLKSPRHFGHVVPLLLGVMLGACSSVPQNADNGAATFVELLRETPGDYDLHTPEGLLEIADAVVVAELVSVNSGRSVEAMGAQAVLTARVLSTVKGPMLPGDSVYIEVPTSPVATVEAYRDRLPAGRVAFFLDDRSDVPSNGPTGVPDGARIYAPMPPTPVFENGKRPVFGYEDFADLPPEWSVAVDIDALIADLRAR